MKLKITILFTLLIALLFPLHAQESAAKDSYVEAEKELPEPTDPPFSVGDRATIQGYYIPIDDDTSLNFRFLGNRMRVYWVDADDFIVAPRASAGNVRFLASVRGPIFFGMALANGEDGLGSLGGPVFVPHLFTVILSLEKTDSEEFDIYTFRYSQAMNATRETRELIIDNNEKSNDKRSNDKSYYESKSVY